MGEEFRLRLYSVADVPQTTDEGHQRFTICVRRCNYIDSFSGERYPGLASNFLCDRTSGDSLTVTGPYGQAFELPRDLDATLIMIGAGTGIAPFRAFIKHIYKCHPDFAGRILLFHGGETGLDMLYRNQQKDDFELYYDRDTFEAIDALSKRPGWSDDIDWGSPLHARAQELSNLLSDPKTFIYVAGREAIRDELDTIFAEVVGSKQRWQQWQAELRAEHRWIELLY
jgi:ferredoxin--NADP+ reductase